MKIAWLSHSLINPRQYRFVNYIQNTYPDIDILQIYPKKWRTETRKNGYKTYGDSMANFLFDSAAYQDILDFNPDLIYLQNELWSRIANQVAQFTQITQTPLAIFVWENLRPLSNHEKTILETTNLVICGNHEAQKRLPNEQNTTIIPQVGIDTNLFTPSTTHPTHDIIFPSRPSPEKGWNTLQQATKNLDLTIHRPWKQNAQRKQYGDMAQEYRKAQICVQPSIQTQTWMEQFNYSIGEALSCGLSAIASDCGSLPTTWGNCDAVTIVPQNDPDALTHALKNPPSPDTGRTFVKQNYSYPAVAQRLTDTFNKLLA